jgi:farnesyl-diphosphate farnesyltransferase
MTKSGKSGDSFIQEYIPRVSRTFALTIKFLPRGLRNSVYMSYLLCRVADTLEDTPYMTPEEKSHRLLKLKDVLLDSAESGKFDPNSISTVYKSVNHLKDDEHKLLSESATLFEILDKLPVSQKIIIYRWVAEMAEGLA